MLPIKSKYKIAKRLGGSIFEPTQTQKFTLSETRTKRPRGGRKGSSDYNRQLLEKQRLRFTYGLKEKELSNYATRAYVARDLSQALHSMLEMRVDSVVYRAGLAPTRRAARQMVSHGHITINGKRTTIPSFRLKKGDELAVREGSKKSTLFGHLTEESRELSRSVPQWLSLDPTLMKVKVLGEPVYGPAETIIDYKTVFEFYSR